MPIIHFFSSCNHATIYQTVIVSYSPSQNIIYDGIHEALPGGYGTIAFRPRGAITYPSLFLANADPIAKQIMLVVSDYHLPSQWHEKIYFSLYIHYSSHAIDDLEIRLIPLEQIISTKEEVVNFQTQLLQDDFQKRGKKFFFSIPKSQLPITITSIPFTKKLLQITFDVTKIQQEIPHGFVLLIPTKDNPDYISSSKKMLSNSGTLEFASPQWELWDGTIPSNFSPPKMGWQKINNLAFKTNKYSPAFRIIK